MREEALEGIDATGPDDVWVVGWRDVKGIHNFADHWGGRKWRTTNPAPRYRGVFKGVAAVSSDDVWAVGYADEGGGTSTDSMIQHWDGHTWTDVAVPVVVGETDILLSVDAISADDVIATGRYYEGDGCRLQTLHWDGTSWTRQTDGPLADIRRASASSPEDAWAVGSEACGYSPSILQHWNGSTWQRKTIPGAPDGASMGAVEARTSTDA